MPQLDRLHTAVALALVALVPVAPLALWLYVEAASADRGHALAANERLLHSAPAPPGTQVRLSSYSGRPRWGNEGGLVPVDGYGATFLLRLRKADTPAAIIAHYRRELTGWRPSVTPVACTSIGLRRGCGAVHATFTRGRSTFEVQMTGRTRNYVIYVSQ